MPWPLPIFWPINGDITSLTETTQRQAVLRTAYAVQHERAQLSEPPDL